MKRESVRTGVTAQVVLYAENFCYEVVLLSFLRVLYAGTLGPWTSKKKSRAARFGENVLGCTSHVSEHEILKGPRIMSINRLSNVFSSGCPRAGLRSAHEKERPKMNPLSAGTTMNQAVNGCIVINETIPCEVFCTFLSNRNRLPVQISVSRLE